MALFNCPQCGQPVSEKAKFCPHCGYAVPNSAYTNGEYKKCPECGAEYLSNTAYCPNCGCPPEHSAEAPAKKKMSPAAIIAIVLAALLLVGGTGYFAYAKISEKLYAVNFNNAASLMMDGGVEAERTCGLVHDVWGNAIFNKKDSATDKFTRPDGKFVKDFNDALANLYADDDYQQSTAFLRDNRNEVTALMRKLKNPPKKYEEAYEKISEIYDNYLKMLNMATNPTGTYSSYTDDFSAVDKELADQLTRIAIYMD